MVLAIDEPASTVPETVVVPSGKLQLKAFLWKPNGPGPFPTVLFDHGSGGSDADHTAGLPMITLLAAERDNTVRAVVTFAAAAGSWDRSPELRRRLRAAAEKAAAPIMLIQAKTITALRQVTHWPMSWSVGTSRIC